MSCEQLFLSGPSLQEIELCLAGLQLGEVEQVLAVQCWCSW